MFETVLGAEGEGEAEAGKVEAEAEVVEAEVVEGAEAEADKDKEADADKDKDKKPEGAPEAYADFTMPDGVEVDSAKLETAQPLFKELNLTQDQAQKLVDFYAGNVKEMAEAQMAAWTAQNEAWVEAAKTDKEFGGDKFDEAVGTANKAIKEFGSKELVEALGATGAGNHPEFIRFAYRIGKAMSEDKFVTGEQSVGKRSAAEILFGGTSDKNAT